MRNEKEPQFETLAQDLRPLGLTWACRSSDPPHRIPRRGPRNSATHRHDSGTRLRALS
jgi:hypothetical protein